MTECGHDLLPAGPRDDRASGVLPEKLLGRRAEVAVMDDLLAQARGGIGGALALWGEPGIGKSALLRYVRDRAEDFVRLSYRAARPESDLAYAGLHGLLRPMIDCTASLPAVQASALRTALGSSIEPASHLLIASAVLSILGEIADQQPVLVVLDDAQWLDEATAVSLGIVARRVRVHPVVVVLADHSDPAARRWAGIPALQVEGLADDSARQLVEAVAPSADEAVVEDMVRAAGGNPLALEEFAAYRSDDAASQADGGLPPLGPRLRRAFRAGLEALSPPARLLAVVAAAEGHGDRLTVQRAGRASGADDAVWDEVTDAGLFRVVGDRVEFRHPVVSRAVYEGSGAAVRRRAHSALAATMSPDAEDHVWHLAAATHEHDEEVAGLLERDAARSRSRGAAGPAVRALRSAATLSPAPRDASRRLAAAARAAWDAGRATAAERLLDDAERLAPGAHLARSGEGLRGAIELARGVPELAHHYLTTDMGRVSDPGTALDLGAMALHAGWLTDRDDLQARAVELLLTVEPEDRAGALRLPPWWTAKERADVDSVVVAGHDDVVALARTTRQWLLPPAPLGLAWGIDKPLGDALRRRTPHLRRRSEHVRLAAALTQGAMLDNLSGRWADAESAAREGLQLAEKAGADHIASQSRIALGWLAAVRGDARAVDEIPARTLAVSLPQGVRALSAAAYWVRGMASLFHERPEEALDLLVRLTEPDHDAAHTTFALLASLDTAEAAVRVGQPDITEERVRALEAWSLRTGAPWARISAHLTAALLTGPHAEGDFQAALGVPGGRSRPLLHARAQLLYGEWLRRNRRRTDARVQLSAAAEAFERLGAKPLRTRARREHDLTGPPGHRGKPEPGAVDRLTAQEERVALLAAEHLTNREIAAQLRISHRTVGHHLGNVFAKLGISARAELSRTRLECRPNDRLSA
jgi:DNA-binding CsgD family transcriptional regulator